MRLLVITQAVDATHRNLAFFHTWVERLAHAVDTLLIVCLEKGTHALPENTSVYSLGKEHRVLPFIYILRFYKYVTPLILFRRVDRIFVHMNEVYIFLLLPFLLIRKIYGIRLVWWKTHARLSTKAQIARLFVDRVLTANPHVYAQNPVRTTLSGHGIDVSSFSYAPRETHAELRIVTAGRPSRLKYYEDMILAVSKLIREGYAATLDIFGVLDTSEGHAYQGELKGLIQKEKLGDTVRLHPPISHEMLRTAFSKADVVMNITFPETMDKVLLEGMAGGAIPLTITSVFKPLLEPRGLFPRDRSVDALFHILKKIAEMKEGERTPLRQEMRSYVETNHSIEAIVEHILNV